MQEVVLVCDGSSLKNGSDNSPAAAAALLEWNGQRKIFGEYLGVGTNQQAEIVAACIGLEHLKRPCRVTVISDSQYVVKTMKGEFRRKANHEFWSRLDKAAQPHRVTWTWTRGHAGHPLQEACDKAARRTAETGQPDPDYFATLLADLK
ncbi:MAG: ribonuclease HI [Blastocatellia bacterium]|nr:ribonuclease HI [Blastocatellia bacterium]